MEAHFISGEKVKRQEIFGGEERRLAWGGDGRVPTAWPPACRGAGAPGVGRRGGGRPPPAPRPGGGGGLGPRDPPRPGGRFFAFCRCMVCKEAVL